MVAPMMMVVVETVSMRSRRRDVPGMSSYGDLIMEFEDALLTQRETCSSGQGLTELRDNRFLGRVEHRLRDLEGLKALQKKVRSDVSSEYWLHASCACPDKQLYDWGMMWVRDIQYGIGDAFVVEGDGQLRKQQDAEREFFADLLNAAREINVQVGATLRHRKARSDGLWHVRQRQKATRQGKLRIQAIKARD
ncbi:putative ATP-dependent DNA helicase CHR23 [Drosera capensis]